NIELVIDDKLKIVGAARITLQSRKQAGFFAYATRKHATEPLGSNSHVIGVDGGTVGVVDAASLMALPRRERERLYHALCDASVGKQRRGAAFVQLDPRSQAWAIDSGCGDGGYAAYWQLSKEGEPLSLAFDFADLALPIWKTVKVPLKLAG